MTSDSVTGTVPFPVSGQLYFFGFPFNVGFIIIYLFCLRRLVYTYRLVGDPMGSVLVSFGTIGMLQMHQYQLRSSFRFLVYTALLAPIVAKALIKRKRRQDMLEAQVVPLAHDVPHGKEVSELPTVVKTVTNEDLRVL